MSNKKQDKTKIVQIWGEILDEGFTSVPNILLRYRSKIGLKPKHIMLIIDIMSYKWNAEYPFPSNATLALRAGIEERSVKRITQDLEELGLLIKTPRFDYETGAQVTTVFDFRPLVQRLIEEMNKGEDLHLVEEDEREVGRVTKENISPQRKIELEIKQKGYDKIVMGEGDKNVTLPVTKLSPGGVTKTSPKENTYNKNTISKRTREKNLTYSRTKKYGKDAKKDKEEGVSKYFREAVFRKRIFEIYDNLVDVKPIEYLVEEAAERACKDIIINRASDFERGQVVVDPIKIAEMVKTEFPYEKLPNDKVKARNFFTKKICDLAAFIVSQNVARNGSH